MNDITVSHSNHSKVLLPSEENSLLQWWSSWGCRFSIWSDSTKQRISLGWPTIPPSEKSIGNSAASESRMAIIRTCVQCNDIYSHGAIFSGSPEMSLQSLPHETDHRFADPKYQHAYQLTWIWRIRQVKSSRPTFNQSINQTSIAPISPAQPGSKKI